MEEPNFDERLAALRMNLEAQSANMHAMQEHMRTMQERQDRLDAREHKARLALLAGIQAYLLALNEPEAGEEK